MRFDDIELEFDALEETLIELDEACDGIHRDDLDELKAEFWRRAA